MLQPNPLAVVMLSLFASSSPACASGATSSASSTPSAKPTASTQPTTSTSVTIVMSAAPSATPIKLASDFKVVDGCTEEGVVLHEYDTSLDGASGRLIVTNNRTVVGEYAFTPDEIASVRKAIETPEFAAFLDLHPQGVLAGEGISCSVTLTSGGETHKIVWTNYDKVPAWMFAAHKPLDDALAKLADIAKKRTFGGACAADADCHLAQGPDCICVAGGPPSDSGSLGKCMANPCTKAMHATCDTTTKRCLVART